MSAPIVFDFHAILIALIILTGAIWVSDVVFFRPRRMLGVAAAEALLNPPKQPAIVDYARSFFPVILVVLLIRSFLFEPFRIPSHSMMPTLLDGDFIFTNKFAYGLRLPVLNTRIIKVGEPERGDVVVFRLPVAPETNYIKRVVGLPGDVIKIQGERIYVNDELVPMQPKGIYSGPNHDRALLAEEQLDQVQHQIILLESGKQSSERVYRVPDGHFFFLGDNRDNSLDSRFPNVGFVPEVNLVGKAVRIWFSWNGSGFPAWGRIGQAVK